MHLRFVLFSLLIASLFAGCQPSQPEPVLAPRFRVKTVTWLSNTTNSLSYQRRYEYDSAGKLTVIKMYSLDNVLQGTPTPFVYQYDNRSRPSWIELGSGGFRTIYYLDSLGRLRDVYQYEPKPFENLVNEEHLFYGADSNPIRHVSIQGRLNMQRLYRYADYVYEKGNIVQVSQRLSFNTGYDFGVSTTNYTYDNKPNPFYGNYLLDRYSPPSFTIHSKDNLIDSTVTRTFDTHGLITSSTGRGGATTSYTYEFY
jgi:hypothetical protein